MTQPDTLTVDLHPRPARELAVTTEPLEIVLAAPAPQPLIILTGALGLLVLVELVVGIAVIL